MSNWIYYGVQLYTGQRVASTGSLHKQVYVPGEECEFDWGEIKLVIGGIRRRLYLAVFTSAYSNYRFCRLFHRQDTLAFMEAHNEFFAHLGGVISGDGLR